MTKPFDGDPNKERMRGLDGLAYSFVAADKVPGAIQSISIEAVGADGTRLFSESVTYDATARYASSPSSSPPRPAPASAPRRRSRTIIRPNTRADYVFACMAVNGETRENLERCSCSVDILASILPYDRYVQAETILSMRQGVGQTANTFRSTKMFDDIVADLRRAQAEAEIRCFR